jgi:hypothetical protein
MAPCAISCLMADRAPITVFQCLKTMSGFFPTPYMRARLFRCVAVGACPLFVADRASGRCRPRHQAVAPFPVGIVRFRRHVAPLLPVANRALAASHLSVVAGCALRHRRERGFAGEQLCGMADAACDIRLCVGLVGEDDVPVPGGARSGRPAPDLAVVPGGFRTSLARLRVADRTIRLRRRPRFLRAGAMARSAIVFHDGQVGIMLEYATGHAGGKRHRR